MVVIIIVFIFSMDLVDKSNLLFVKFKYYKGIIKILSKGLMESTAAELLYFNLQIV